MAGLLVEKGKVTIYCADGAGTQSPAKVEVVHVPDGNAGHQNRIFAGRAKGSKLVRYFRKVASSFLFWPDRQAKWAQRAVGQMQGNLRDGKNHVVVTCGPIFSVHSEMRKWVQHHPGQVQWVMDFRDLWANEIAPGIQRRIPHFLTWFEKKMEQKCHDLADVVTVISEGMAQMERKVYGSTPVVLYNGYYAGKTPSRPEHSYNTGEPRCIRYLGTIIPGLRSPALLFEAAAELGFKPTDLKFEFWCNDHSLVIGEAKRYNVESLVECNVGVSREKAWELSCKADANLILNGLGADSNQVVTGKVFELMQSNRPIIPITGKESELRQIAENCGTKHVVWDLGTARSALESLTKGKLPRMEDAKGLYSWENTVNKFLQLTAPKR